MHTLNEQNVSFPVTFVKANFQHRVFLRWNTPQIFPIKPFKSSARLKTNKKYSLCQHFLSSIAQVTSINIMFHFCSMWLSSCFRILLPIRAQIGTASVLGYSLWKPGQKLEMLEDFSDGTAGMDPERNKRLDSLRMEDPTSKSLSSFKIRNVVYLPEKWNSNQSCNMTNISPDGNIRWNIRTLQDPGGQIRLDFDGALDLTDKLHVSALAVFTVLLCSNRKSRMYFKLTVTIESDSVILVGPCQLTTFYANNQKNQRKVYKNDHSQIQFIF